MCNVGTLVPIIVVFRKTLAQFLCGSLTAAPRIVRWSRRAFAAGAFLILPGDWGCFSVSAA